MSPPKRISNFTNWSISKKTIYSSAYRDNCSEKASRNKKANKDEFQIKFSTYCQDDKEDITNEINNYIITNPEEKLNTNNAYNNYTNKNSSNNSNFEDVNFKFTNDTFFIIKEDENNNINLSKFNNQDKIKDFTSNNLKFDNNILNYKNDIQKNSDIKNLCSSNNIVLSKLNIPLESKTKSLNTFNSNNTNNNNITSSGKNNSRDKYVSTNDELYSLKPNHKTNLLLITSPNKIAKSSNNSNNNINKNILSINKSQKSAKLIFDIDIDCSDDETLQKNNTENNKINEFLIDNNKLNNKKHNSINSNLNKFVDNIIINNNNDNKDNISGKYILSSPSKSYKKKNSIVIKGR